MKLVNSILLFIILYICPTDVYSVATEIHPVVSDNIVSQNDYLLAANASSVTSPFYTPFLTKESAKKSSISPFSSISPSPYRPPRRIFWDYCEFANMRRSIFRLVLKNNLIYSAFTVPNLGVEMGFAPQWTVDLSFSYDAFNRKENSQMKQFITQAELRFWPYQQFDGHFFGIHLIGGMYNVGGELPYGIKVSDLMNHRYKGTIFGTGVSYGYHFPVSVRWSLEATLGIGYARLNYDRYRCVVCGEKLNSDTENYFGPTRFGINLTYIIF